jgi:hypothetical protein
MVRSSIGVVLLLAACSSSRAPLPAPDLSNVMETFAPSKVPVGQALGVSWHPMAGSDNATDLGGLQQLGAAVVRYDFARVAIETAPGVYDFSQLDPVVAATVAHGIATVGILDDGGDWNAPTDFDAWSAFAEACARHFAGQVQAWEIWNEENLGFRFWKPAEDPGAYGVLLQHMHDGVKRGDPNALVLLGGLNSQGLSSTGEDFLADAYFAHPDLGASYDALAVHPYPDYPPVRAPEDTVGVDRAEGLKLSRLRAMLSYYGDPDKPIWVTEYGWPVSGTVTEAVQANYDVRGAILALAAGADRVMVYTLNDGAHPTAFPPEDAFGLLRNDGTHKPSFDALAQLIGRDSTAVLVEDHSTDTLRSYVLQGSAGRASVTWNTAPDGAPVYSQAP